MKIETLQSAPNKALYMLRRAKRYVMTESTIKCAQARLDVCTDCLNADVYAWESLK